MNIPAGLSKSDFAYAVFLLGWAAVLAVSAVFNLDLYLFLAAACVAGLAGSIYTGQNLAGHHSKFELALLIVAVILLMLSPTKVTYLPFVVLLLGYGSYTAYRLIRKRMAAG